MEDMEGKRAAGEGCTEKIPEAASQMDEPWIRQLLIMSGLPHEDITTQHLAHFWVIKEREEILGVIGLELFGRSALVRSLAVHPRQRNQGWASRLEKKAEEYAASSKIQVLYLLTTTAEKFFQKRGFCKIDRGSAPEEIRGTAEFQGLCPISSVLMMKKLTG